MRKATNGELLAWLTLVPNGEMDNVHSAWVLEGYTTDTPGYQGPIGWIVWSGSPSYQTIFTFNGRIEQGAWEVCVDTVQLTEGDQRGCFEELEKELQENPAYGGLLQVMDNNQDEVGELFETGSVTMRMLGRKFLLTLNVKEVT